MRIQSLLAACAASLLMPLAAQAQGKFPEGAEQAYTAQCQQVAQGKGLDQATAKKHCDCGAQAIKQNFNDNEIAELDSKNGVNPQLLQKAQTVVQKACTR
ncbi:hypothetical protein IAE35_00255 [Pseudomonas sp. S75]|uniref:hypothetical protein n=1 Tax=unclassified Pseudomonas TaxID=196821 RepID=UPI001905D043|nr:MULTISPECIES: hypothetical protein [unclassified Pseudomonas]MBJ9974301.1 hypothetical protein [Pseudomonas sp. S30]MBK0151769.1 hypothetical protein [Pseudomonas sp. S75]